MHLIGASWKACVECIRPSRRTSEFDWHKMIGRSVFMGISTIEFTMSAHKCLWQFTSQVFWSLETVVASSQLEWQIVKVLKSGDRKQSGPKSVVSLAAPTCHPEKALRLPQHHVENPWKAMSKTAQGTHLRTGLSGNNRILDGQRVVAP